MKKKILLAVMVIAVGVFAFSAISASAATSGKCGYSLTWTLDGDTLTITGQGSMYDWSYYTQSPWHSSREDIVKVVIEDNVTSIGDDAFSYCQHLASITIPNSVTHIGDYAFYECSSLATIEIPDSIAIIGNDAFSWCISLASITIPDSVTSIGDSAFYNCSNLASIAISDSVSSIGWRTFSYCTSLADVYYKGTEEEWNKISIGSDNNPLKNATIHFAEPEKPAYTPSDLNTDSEVDVRDVILLRRYVTGGYGIELDEKLADFNKDDSVDVRDVILLRRYVAGGYGIEL